MSIQPKYRLIYDTLTAELADGTFAPGQKLPTEEELAQRFGVTRQTVLKALAIMKVQGLITAVRGRGTFVVDQNAAPRPPGFAQRQLVFICSNFQDSHGHRVLIGAERAAGRLGYSLATCNTNYDVALEAEHLRRARANRVDGVVLLPYLSDSRRLVEDISARTPLVCIDNGYEGLDAPVVTIDNFRAMYDAVGWLIAQGHRRIGFILTQLEITEHSPSVRDRYAGYRRALNDHGIDFSPEWVAELGPALANASPSEIGLELYGYPAMHRLLNAAPRPTAVIALWDEIAPGAYAAIRDARLKVPDDFSIIGFNDDELCALLSPPLTTLRQPSEAMGERAVELVDGLLNGQRPEQTRILIPSTLVRRHSVSPPRPAPGE